MERNDQCLSPIELDSEVGGDNIKGSTVIGS